MKGQHSSYFFSLGEMVMEDDAPFISAKKQWEFIK